MSENTASKRIEKLWELSKNTHVPYNLQTVFSKVDEIIEAKKQIPPIHQVYEDIEKHWNNKKKRAEYNAEVLFEYKGKKGFEMKVVVFKDDPIPKVFFRGSQSTDWKDWETDADSEHVGFTQFETNKDKIQFYLNQAAEKSPTGKVELVGHSLGGALAQTTASKFTDKVQSIITFQSPGISKSRIDAFLQNKNGLGIEISSFHYMTKDDFVHKAGAYMTPGTVFNFDLRTHFPWKGAEAHLARLLTRFNENRIAGVEIQKNSDAKNPNFNPSSEALRYKIGEIYRELFKPKKFHNYLSL